jgi:hypothetical protein
VLASGISTFTFTTASVLPIGGTITISLPPNYFTGLATPGGTLTPASGSAMLSGCAMTPATLTIVCTTAGAVLQPGPQIITFAVGQLTTGAPRLSVSTGLSVATSADVVSSPSLSPAIGGQVTSATLTLAAGDNVAQRTTTGITTISFNTATPVPVGGTITISLPPKYLPGPTSPTCSLYPETGSAMISGVCSLTSSLTTITCSVGGEPLPSGYHSIKFPEGQLSSISIFFESINEIW